MKAFCMILCIPRRQRKPSTTQPSSARRLSGVDATPTATAVAGEVSELGRVPSGPWLGPTGTAGPENCISTFTTELLAQRANRGWRRGRLVARVVRSLARQMVDCLSRFSRLSRPTAPSAPSMTIGAVPPAKRHGAGPGHHFGIICKRDRRPRARQLSPAGFVFVVRSRNAHVTLRLLCRLCQTKGRVTAALSAYV